MRVEGRRNGSGSLEKETTSGNMPAMENDLREVSLIRPHLDRGVWIFPQSAISRDVREVRFRI